MPRPALTAQALLDPYDQLWLPFDKASRGLPDAGFVPLSARRQVLNANLSPFRLDYPALRRVLVINGMGVALGDSVIGLSALHWLLETCPALQLTLWRACTTPASLEALYAHPPARLQVEYLPQPLARLDEFDAVIDLADFLYRPAFNTRPMIDFFLDSLGLDPAQVPARVKSNVWLQQTYRRQPAKDAYLLFCPQASTPLRSIPEAAHAQLIDALWQRFRCPILGFSRARHPAFTDVSARSRSLQDFIALIAGARHVVSTDSAAVHLAAGMEVPSTAFFVSIPPRLRTRDYPHCESIHLDRQGLLAGLHASGDAQRIAQAHALWAQAPHALAAAPG